MKHTKVISLLNFKGGCSKTMTTDLVCYELAKRMHKKVLIVDLDPQANSTQVLGRTYKEAHGKRFKAKETIMTAVSKNDLSNAITNIIPNLDLLPSSDDFNYYPWYVINKCFNRSKSAHQLHIFAISLFDYLMQPIIKSGKYDYIFYDCPPTVSTYVESALLDIDYIGVILQTEEPSYDEAEEFLKYSVKFSKEHKLAHYKFLGMIAVLKKRSPIDNHVLNKAEKHYGKESLMGTIKWYRRVERYSSEGITDKDHLHDPRIHDKYTKLAKSIISRVNKGGM